MPRHKQTRDNHRLTLAPLSFDEAVTDILKIKPMPKPKKKPKAQKQQKARP